MTTPPNTEAPREAAHKALDAYLDNGGSGDFVIMSRTDANRNIFAQHDQARLTAILAKAEEVWTLKMINKSSSNHSGVNATKAVPVSVIKAAFEAVV